MKIYPTRTKIILTMLLTFLLIFSFIQTSSAQADVITGSGTISGGPLPFGPTLSLTFPPKGGDVTGTVSGEKPFNNGAETCTQSFSGSVAGTFAGGDNGAASGSMNMTYLYPSAGVAFVVLPDSDLVFYQQCVQPTTLDEYMSTWGADLLLENPYTY